MNVHPLRAVADAEFRTLEKDGFVQLRGMLDEDWIERMRRATEAMLDCPGPAGGDFNEGGQGGRMAFDKDMWLRNDDFRAFIFESPMAELAATILDSPVVNLVTNVLLCKEPHTPTVTSFHQDVTGNAVEGPALGMRVSLDTETAESGAMQWVRGSHRWGRWFIPYEAGADAEIAEKASGFVDPDRPERELEPMPDIEGHRQDYDIVTTPTEPGDILVSSLLVLHGAPGNFTDNRRRAFICRFAGAGSTYAVRGNVPFSIGPPADPGLSNGDPFPDDPGHPVYPRLWPRDEAPRRAAE